MDTYYPYGVELYPQVIPTHYQSTGKERDAESGNDYFGARYYSGTMGRFLSPDWSAKEEPVPYAKLDDPQSLNLYAYVRPSRNCNPRTPEWTKEGLAIAAKSDRRAADPASRKHSQMSGRDRNLHKGTVLYLARHTFATDIMAETGNVFVTKELMGHSSTATLSRYRHPVLAGMAAAINKRNTRK